MCFTTKFFLKKGRMYNKSELIYPGQRLRGRTVVRCEDAVASELFVALSPKIPSSLPVPCLLLTWAGA